MVYPPRYRSQRGFTLLEVLVAFVIFALVFATTLQILSGSIRNTQRSADYTEAALWAQTAMESLGFEPPLEEGSFNGDFENGYRWEMDILALDPEELFVEQAVQIDDPDDEAVEQQVTDPSTALAADSGNLWDVPIDLFEVELRIYWGEPGQERMSRFRTLRSMTPDNDG